MNRYSFFIKNILFYEWGSNGFFKSNPVKKIYLSISFKECSFLIEPVCLILCFFFEFFFNNKVKFYFSTKSVAQWQLEKGILVSFEIVLYKFKMFAFFERFLLIILPKVRPFKIGFFKTREEFFFILPIFLFFYSIDKEVFFNKLNSKIFIGVKVIFDTTIKGNNISNFLLCKGIQLPCKKY